MQRTLCLLLVAGLAGDWETARGKRFEVHAQTSVKAAKVLAWAEETGKAFESLVGSFRGKRVAIVVAPASAALPTIGVDPAPPPAAAADEDWRFLFPPDLAGEVVGSLVPRTADEETRFRHLLGHRLLAEWTSGLPGGGPKPDGSGCPLPDWFEEAVAVDMEPVARKKDYLKAMGDFARAGRAWGIADLLALQRSKGERKPGGGGGGKGGDAPAAIPPGLDDEDRARLEAALREKRKLLYPDDVVDHAEGMPFEVESWSLLEFMRREYGAPFLRHVAATLGANRGFVNVYAWLAEHRAELRDPKAAVPGTDRELEVAFLAWAKAR